MISPLLTDGLLLHSEFIAFIGFIAIDVITCAIGAPRLQAARSFHDVLAAMRTAGAIGIAALAIWLALTLTPFSAITLTVLLVIWIAVFGLLARWSSSWHSARRL
jgi:hypothetical protein